MEQVKFDPNKLAVLYYFGDLSYWQLPSLFADALEYGFDGRFLRRLAGLVNPVASDIRPDEIDAAFREMGVAAPVPKDEARLVLATEAAKRAIAGESNVFDEATHIRIHLCEWDNAPRWRWHQLEKELRDAMSKFLITRQ